MVARALAGVLLCSVVLLQVAQTRAAINVACETLTGIAYCTECSGKSKECFLCQKTRAPVYNAAGKITQCKATTTGATAIKQSGDPNCARSDGVYCVECNAGFYFDANFVCRNAAGSPSRLSGNPNCAAVTPDGVCTKCRAANPPFKLLPLNALYINAGYPQTTCMTQAAINAEAQRIVGRNAIIPANCIEVDSTFTCTRCVDGQSLVAGTCRPLATGSKCSTALPYYQYCAKCASSPSVCSQCVVGRGLVGGQCKLPCRLLFGIGCKNCNTVQCLVRDPVYANGRR